MLRSSTLGTFNDVLILLASCSRLRADLIARFRNVPPFGKSTIRKFHNDVSELSRLGGRDYEDIMQVRTVIERQHSLQLILTSHRSA